MSQEIVVFFQNRSLQCKSSSVHYVKVLGEAVTHNGPCSPYLFITPDIILHTSGEWIEAFPPGSSLAPNMGIGSFDQLPPLSTTHALTHLFFPAVPAPPPSSPSVFSRLAATEQGSSIFRGMPERSHQKRRQARLIM